ncbi:hypothetical protein [Kribbella swartbergensis]
MTAQLAADGPAVARPILTIELLEHLLEISPNYKAGELARTLIVRILDRLDTDGVASPASSIE